MAYTIEQYNSLSESIALGALMVEYSDKKVTYRSLSDMIRIQQLMAGELGLLITDNLSDRRKYASFSNGMNKCDNDSGITYGAQ